MRGHDRSGHGETDPEPAGAHRSVHDDCAAPAAVPQLGFAFGGAKPVPVASWNLRKPLRDMMLVALAGPAVNLLLAALFLLAYKFVFYVMRFEQSAILVQVLFQSMVLNLVLAAFNMIPIPPLDGSRVMSYFLPASVRQQYQRLESFGMI